MIKSVLKTLSLASLLKYVSRIRLFNPTNLEKMPVKKPVSGSIISRVYIPSGSLYGVGRWITKEEWLKGGQIKPIQGRTNYLPQKTGGKKEAPHIKTSQRLWPEHGDEMISIDDIKRMLSTPEQENYWDDEVRKKREYSSAINPIPTGIPVFSYVNQLSQPSIETMEKEWKKYRDEANKMPNTGNAKDIQIGGDHYKKHTLQPWDVWEAFNLDAFEASVIKYLLRWKDKGGVQDLEKAQHTLGFYIEMQKKKKGGGA